jgi:hypothetical protein
MAQFTDSNDQVKGWQGDAQDVVLPSDVTAAEDLAYLDSVEFSSVDNKIRKATGADNSKYLGIVADSGGIRSGKTGRVIRGVTCKKTLSGSCSQGDLLEATDGSTVAKVTTDLGPYPGDINTFGMALEAQTTGNTLLVLVNPNILV